MADAGAIAREYLEAFNRRDWEKMRSLCAGSYSYTGGDGNRMEGGPDVAVNVAQMFSNAMSDAKITIKTIHVAGDTAACEFTGTGTHDGDFQGIPASGRKVTMPVITVLDIKDGKIAAEREYMDAAHLLQQMGAMPAPARA
jgi:steroid delta-isomerase-like uncharacterized protein